MADADIAPLALAVVHLTADIALLDAIAPYIQGPWDSQVSMPDRLASDIREKAFTALQKRSPSPILAGQIGSHLALLHRMMSVAAGETVPDAYVPMFLEHVLPGLRGLSAEPPSDRNPCDMRQADSPRALIVGAGASGLCAAIRLGQLGIPYVLLEKNDDVGGTWYDNRYPGCAVDLPSHHYEYSFERNHEWPHYYSRQPAVLAYLRSCAEKYAVLGKARFGREVQSAEYDEITRSWNVKARTPRGTIEEHSAEILIVSVGQLNLPLVPKIDGLEQFRGRSFHTANWPDDYDLAGKRVALVGTGPSAVQLGPAIAKSVEQLHVFQRSGNWISKRPRINESVSASTSWLLANVPYYSEWLRFRLFWAFGDSVLEAFRIDPNWVGRSDSINEINAKYRSVFVRYVKRELEGRDDLVEKSIPSYPPFSRRVIADPGWYRMLRLPNVNLIDTGIDRVSAREIHTTDGASYPVDVIVFATGFRADHMLGSMDIRGNGGRTLRSVWGSDNPRAYLGIMVPEFPNLFLLYGPNSNFAHGGSAIFMAECQVNYVLNMLRMMMEKGYASAEVRKQVHDSYNEHLDEELRKLAWSDPSIPSWYKNAQGRIVANQPWRLVDYWALTKQPKADEFIFFKSRSA